MSSNVTKYVELLHCKADSTCTDCDGAGHLGYCNDHDGYHPCPSCLADYEPPNFDDDVEAERQRQRDKWGEQRHSLEWWYVILGEEFGEVGRAIFEGYDGNLREELVQVAAVAKAIVEQIDNG